MRVVESLLPFPLRVYHQPVVVTIVSGSEVNLIDEVGCANCITEALHFCDGEPVDFSDSEVSTFQ